MVIEAGLEVELPVLRQIGLRGLLIGIVGSLLPLFLGFCIGYWGFNMAWQSALAAGATLSPTSMGIALVVLKSGRVLNTPTGQLVVASAVIDDILALIILSELRALVNPTVEEFVVPIVSALAFTLGVGAFGIWVMPHFIRRVLLPLLPKGYVEDGLLALILLTAVGLSAALHYGRASYLFGAFLAGLCFCTASSVMTVWTRQVKRILKWLLRLFFACTVGFQIPASEFGNAKVIGMGFAFFCAIVGKLLMGFFANPFTLYSFLVVGFAMSAWGEFAFIVSGSAHSMGLLNDVEYAALLFAVLLSVILGPYGLRATILYYNNRAKRKLEEAKFGAMEHLRRTSDESRRKKESKASLTEASPMQGLSRPSLVFIDATEDEFVRESVKRSRSGTERTLAGVQESGAIFYKLDVRTKLAWGLMGRLLKAIQDLGLEVVEFRADVQGSMAMYEAFLKDQVLRDTTPETPDAEGLADRLIALRAKLLAILRMTDPEAVDALAETLGDTDVVTVDASQRSFDSQREGAPCNIQSASEGQQADVAVAVPRSHPSMAKLTARALGRVIVFDGQVREVSAQLKRMHEDKQAKRERLSDVARHTRYRVNAIRAASCNEPSHRWTSKSFVAYTSFAGFLVWMRTSGLTLPQTNRWRTKLFRSTSGKACCNLLAQKQRASSRANP